MATDRKTAAASKRTVSRAAPGAIKDGWRSRVHRPAETDPKKRVEAIHQAASLIKTDARIDTITLGRD